LYMRYRIYAKDWGEIEMKKGTSVMIYRETKNKRIPEGVCKLIKKIKSYVDGKYIVETWKVRLFINKKPVIAFRTIREEM
jgi:hypothetical protein